ncbi:MAG: hypothetical protein ACOCOU_09525, partial [Prevotella sp.]
METTEDTKETRALTASSLAVSSVVLNVMRPARRLLWCHQVSGRHLLWCWSRLRLELLEHPLQQHRPHTPFRLSATTKA